MGTCPSRSVAVHGAEMRFIKLPVEDEDTAVTF